MAGFTFVAWAREPDPNKLAYFLQRLVDVGVPPSEVTFVFEQQLVAALRAPRFARVRSELLGLRAEPAPFQAIEEAPIYGGADVATFAPTKDEFINGYVHRPEVIEQVVGRLLDTGWALIRGRGAAGKTVLGVEIAFDERLVARPAYYFDFAKADAREAGDRTAAQPILSAVTEYGDDGILFVLDNIHVDEATARLVFDHWHGIGKPGLLLLIGRDVSLGSNVRGLSRPFEDVEHASIRVDAGVPELLGVLKRLIGRRGALADVTEVPAETLREWASIYEGDLIAFSAAVARRVEGLRRGVWRLEPADAVDYVKSTYWSHRIFSSRERASLLRVAAMGSIEEGVRRPAVDPAELTPFLTMGIVHRFADESGFEMFHIVHPGIGILILAAADVTDGGFELFRSMVTDDPPLAGVIAKKLAANGRYEEGRLLLEAALSDSDAFLDRLLAAGLGRLELTVRALERLDVLSREQVDEPLAAAVARAWRPRLDENLLSTLRFAELRLPETYSAIGRGLESPGNAAQINREVEDLLSNLSVLLALLRYSEARYPSLHRTVRDILETPRHYETITRQAWDNLQSLVFFLDITEERLPAEYQRVLDTVREPESVTRLTELAVTSKLDFLTRLFEHLARAASETELTLRVELSKPDALRELARAACDVDLGTLSRFADSPVAEHVIDAISLEEWVATRTLAKMRIDELPSFERKLRRFERPELAQASARFVVRSAWSTTRGVMRLYHLSTALRLAYPTEFGDLQPLLDSIVSESWLANTYRRGPAGSIASSLYEIRCYCDDATVARFRSGELDKRVATETRSLRWIGAKRFSEALRLVGSAWLVGAKIRPPQQLQHHPDALYEGLARSVSQKKKAKLQETNALLWLGIRALSQFHGPPIQIPPEFGGQTLRLWRKAHAATAQQRALNTWMIEWLQQCAAREWKIRRGARISLPSFQPQSTPPHRRPARRRSRRTAEGVSTPDE